MIDQTLYAFYRSDRVPFFRWHIVEGFTPHGGILTRKDGGGLCPWPIRILPDEYGKAVADRIDALAKEYNERDKLEREKIRIDIGRALYMKEEAVP